MTCFGADPGPRTKEPSMTQVLTEMLRSLDPATGEMVGEVPVTPPATIPALVARAREAQAAWGDRSPAARAQALGGVGQAILDAAGDLAALVTREMGKPMAEAASEVRSCGTDLPGELAEMVEALAPEILEDARTRSTVYHDPFGVCAAIAPWNFPVAMPHSMVIPALVAGNAVVLKPSEETPLSGQAYADVLNRTLPPGLLTVIHGADAQGKALVAADVDLIAFTGSRETGKHILESASKGLKRVVLELGGKDPLIVLDDADLEKAASFAVHNSFRNAGQVCVSTERIYVDESVAERFEDLVSRFTAKLKVGPGSEAGVSVGPMINARQKEHVLGQIRSALAQGARLVAGGQDHPGPFIRPTVLSDVSPEMDIMREETFGPVACIARFRSPEEAVRLANDTPFGLGAVVFGGDTERAERVARRLTAGMVGINKSCGGAGGTPWVGARESGYGFHSSRDGHRQFAQVRVVSAPKA
jgi:succinate-semialdehyde dehydrogenase/glutarate-semialdehyde dehydrogenase